MNKKMRELLATIETKTKEAESFMEEGENKNVEKAGALLDEVDALKKEFEAEKRLYETKKAANTPADPEIQQKAEEKKKTDSTKAFADAARHGFKSMNEGTPADGGYTVPEDIQTRINEYRSAKASLLDLVRVENVTTEKGARTFKKRSQQTGFTKVGEGNKITAKNTPQFERITYEISKYAGYFPVTNELLEDSDANITETMIAFIGDESRVTANKLILAAVGKITPTKFAGLDDIKRALNVTLGAAFKATSKIVTNDDGLQYLDTLKDNEGKYLLSPSPADPMKMMLSAGASQIEVKVIPNDDMPSDTTTTPGKTRIPFIIGDLAEAVVYWDRKRTSIVMSTTAAIGELNAFEEDLTIFRAIEREDVTLRDDKAAVNGYIELGE